MQSVSGFFDLIKQFVNGDGLYAIVCAIGLSFVFKLNIRDKKIALLTGVIFILAVFNPISFSLLSGYPGFEAGYYRLLWIVPVTLIMAYGLGEIIGAVNKKTRLLLVIIVCICIVNIYIPKENLCMPDNIYQIPDETVDVANELERLRIESNKEQIRVVTDDKLANTIRQYNANICLVLEPHKASQLKDEYDEGYYGLYFMLLNDRDNMDVEHVKMIMLGQRIDYLVVSVNNRVTLGYLFDNGWINVGSTSQYVILELYKD